MNAAARGLNTMVPNRAGTKKYVALGFLGLIVGDGGISFSERQTR